MDETLEDLKFQVQVTEDETAMLRQMILEGWCAFQVSLRGVPLTAEQKEAMFSEGERWSRCLAAIDSGALRYKRVVAARRA